MKEVISYATNTLAVINDGVLTPGAEVIIVLGEIAYRMTADDTMVRTTFGNLPKFFRNSCYNSSAMTYSPL